MGITQSISLNGLPGTGKTYGTARTVTELGLNAVVLDFEGKQGKLGKYDKTISLCFPECKDQFEIYNLLIPNKTSKTEVVVEKGKKTTQAGMKLELRNAPDYLASFLSLKDDLIDNILSRDDFQVLVMDGAIPILRNHMGLAYWKYLHPGRDNPIEIEWGPMNDIERAFVEAGCGWAEETGGLFILTGQMKDEYLNNTKVGETPCLSVKCRHSIDVVLDLTKHVYRDHTDYVCTCTDSVLGSWIEPITTEKHIVDILLEKNLLSY